MLKKTLPGAAGLLTLNWLLASGCTHDVEPVDVLTGAGGASTATGPSATSADAASTSSGGAATACAAGTIECGSGCVNTMSNGTHCGSCGNACPAGEFCSNGACAASCAAGQTQCGNSCATLSSDPANCGSCGTTCSAACEGGSCVETTAEAAASTNSTTSMALTTSSTTGMATSTDSATTSTSAGPTTTGGMSTTDGGTTTGGMIEPEPEENLTGGPGQCPDRWGGSQDGSVTWYTFAQGTANIGDVNCSFGIQQGPDRVNHVSTGNGEYFAAMNTADYNNAAACGACVEVRRNDTGQSVVVTIVDQCPVGSNDKCVSGHLDLSQAAFSQIGNVGDGYLGNRAGNGQISWEYVPCPTAEDVSFKLKEPDNLYWNEVLVQSHKAPIESVEVRVNGNWVGASRQEYNYWAPPGNDFGDTPFRVRATDIHGNFVEASIELQGGDLDTGLQLCQ